MDNKEFALSIIFMVFIFCVLGGGLWAYHLASIKKETSVEGCWILSDACLLPTPNDSIKFPFIIGDRIELLSNSTFEDTNGLSGMWCSNGKWLNLTYFDDGWQVEALKILSLTKDKLILRISVGDNPTQLWLLTYER